MSMTDIFLIPLILIVLGILILSSHYLKEELLADIKAEIGDTGDEYIGDVEKGFNTLDGVFVFLAVGIPLVAVAFAYFVPTHPMFFWFSLIAFLMLLVVTPTLGNAFREIAAETEFAGFIDEYPMMSFIMENLTKYIVVFGIMMQIALWGGKREGGV